MTGYCEAGAAALPCKMSAVRRFRNMGMSAKQVERHARCQVCSWRSGTRIIRTLAKAIQTERAKCFCKPAWLLLNRAARHAGSVVGRWRRRSQRRGGGEGERGRQRIGRLHPDRPFKPCTPSSCPGEGPRSWHRAPCNRTPRRLRAGVRFRGTNRGLAHSRALMNRG
jgi:hypothetical protein